MIGFYALRKILWMLRPLEDNSKLEFELFKCFASFSDFIDSPISELKRVGFSVDEILFIKSIHFGIERYSDTSPKIINTPQVAGNYIHSLIGYKDKEWSVSIYLNQRNKVLAVDKYSVYNRTLTYQKEEKLLSNCTRTGATKIILGHNHPNGVTSPSKADKSSFESIRKTFALIRIELMDNIVVSPFGYWSYYEEEKGNSYK